MWCKFDHVPPNIRGDETLRDTHRLRVLQGYLAHKKTPSPLGPPQGPRHSPTVGSQGGAVSCERSTPPLHTPVARGGLLVTVDRQVVRQPGSQHRLRRCARGLLVTPRLLMTTQLRTGPPRAERKSNLCRYRHFGAVWQPPVPPPPGFRGGLRDVWRVSRLMIKFGRTPKVTGASYKGTSQHSPRTLR